MVIVYKYDNFEVNAVIYHSDTTVKMEEQFMKDLEVSSEITLYDYARRSYIYNDRAYIKKALGME